MSHDAPGASVLLVTSEGELPSSERVWGTGGWLPPEERESLDWLTLAAFMGWSVQVVHVGELSAATTASPDLRCVVLGCDPKWIGEEVVSWLRSVLAAQPVLVVTRAFSENSPGARIAGAIAQAEPARGRRIRWTGPGDSDAWTCRSLFESQRLHAETDVARWADLDGAPIVAARKIDLGVIATLGFHPSYGRDGSGAVTALLRHLLTRGVLGPVAWLDFQGSMVLRMDDPGGAQNIHFANWAYSKLSELDWSRIAAILRRFEARLSVGYIGGWVDDGESQRGELTVRGRPVPRVAGRVYPSPAVQYLDRNGHAPGTFHDYASEFRGIQRVRSQGAGDVELHGYTHIHPDVKAWSTAPDRYRSVSWYREFGPSAATFLAAERPEEHPLATGVAALRQLFSVEPTTLICPGDEWTDETLNRALDLKISLVSSYYLAIRHGRRFCWATHVCAPYLDCPDAAWFDAGLPVVGYFHDREPALEGTRWISEWLERWCEAGARRFLDFRELAAAVGYHLKLDASLGLLDVRRSEDFVPDAVRPVPILIRTGSAPVPAQITVLQGERTRPLPVEFLKHGLGRAVLPPPSLVY